MIYLGIDPGLTGGIACIDRRGLASIHDVPTVEIPGSGAKVTKRIDGLALARLLRSLVPADEVGFVTLEQVHAIAGKTQGQGGMQQMASLMRSLGAIESLLDAMRMQPLMVVPQTWKRHYHITAGNEPGEPQAQRSKRQKAAALDMARRLYPDAQHLLARVKDHNRAEALLIAHYGRTKAEA